jgi:hypothetical protein
VLERPFVDLTLYGPLRIADGESVATPSQSIYERKVSRSAGLACAFVVGTTLLYAATWLFNLLLIFPDATTTSDRRFAALILYPTAAALTVAAAVAVLRSRSVAFPPGRRAALATTAGSVVSALTIGHVWTAGAGGGAPAYIVFATPLAVAAVAGGTRGTAAAVVLSWTATMLCASVWLAHAMQYA